MAITDNVRKVFTDTTPFYAAAGTVDFAAEKLREVAPLIEKLRDEAPERFEKVRSTDPKVVQERVTQQAKDVQARLTEVFGGVEIDLRRLRDNAQDFALQQVGRAAEYAVKAGETYNGLADRGRGAVRTWRGEAAESVQDLAVTIERGSTESGGTEQGKPAQKQNGQSQGQSATQTQGQNHPKSSAKKPAQGK